MDSKWNTYSKEKIFAEYNGSATYGYDAAGRKITDSQKGTLAYNHLGLVKTVTKNSDVLTYTYDATGRRIKKELSGKTPRYYIDGVEYSGDTITIQTDHGRLRRSSANDPWKRSYFLTDHLGNVRVVIEADDSSSSGSSQSNTVTYLATMETNKSAEEEQYFANLTETRADKPFNYTSKNLSKKHFTLFFFQLKRKNEEMRNEKCIFVV